MRRTHYRSCTLCEATCGVAIEVEGDEVVSIRGDDEDPFSKGYICPKATALADLHADPDRLRQPLVARRRDVARVGWDEALDLVAGAHPRRAGAPRPRRGRRLSGQPDGHNLGCSMFGQLFMRALGTRNRYSATSVDQLPHMLAALAMFGHAAADAGPRRRPHPTTSSASARNPLVSNGSIMTAPDMRGRLKALRARGGKVVVVDPRRTETADVADEHLFIRPGTDALLLLALCT